MPKNYAWLRDPTVELTLEQRIDLAEALETLESARQVQDAALSNLRADLREAVQIRDKDIQRLEFELARARTG